MDTPWYRLIDHTGDMALLVRGPSLAGLYEAATRALFDVIVDVRTVQPAESLPLRIGDAVDAEDLFVRYLSALLFEHDVGGWLFCGAEIRRLTSSSLEANALGERFDAGRHRIEREVKAVTYHHLMLSEDKDGWSARVVLDL